MRKDALYAMAEIILYLHKELDKLDSKLIYTTGEFSGAPNVHTVIPDNVRITLDSRHQDPEVIKQVVSNIKSIVNRNVLQSDEQIRIDIADELIDLSLEYGLDGINVDFENFHTDYRDYFTLFISELGGRCRQEGLDLSVDVTMISTSEYWSIAMIGLPWLQRPTTL